MNNESLVTGKRKDAERHGLVRIFLFAVELYLDNILCKNVCAVGAGTGAGGGGYWCRWGRVGVQLESTGGAADRRHRGIWLVRMVAAEGGCSGGGTGRRWGGGMSGPQLQARVGRVYGGRISR